MSEVIESQFIFDGGIVMNNESDNLLNGDIDAWDDSVIMKVFDEAIKSHNTKQNKLKNNAKRNNNRDIQTSTPNRTMKDSIIHGKSVINGHDQSLSVDRIGEPGPWEVIHPPTKNVEILPDNHLRETHNNDNSQSETSSLTQPLYKTSTDKRPPVSSTASMVSPPPTSNNSSSNNIQSQLSSESHRLLHVHFPAEIKVGNTITAIHHHPTTSTTTSTTTTTTNNNNYSHLKDTKYIHSNNNNNNNVVQHPTSVLSPPSSITPHQPTPFFHASSSSSTPSSSKHTTTSHRVSREATSSGASTKDHTSTTTSTPVSASTTTTTNSNLPYYPHPSYHQNHITTTTTPGVPPIQSSSSSSSSPSSIPSSNYPPINHHFPIQIDFQTGLPILPQPPAASLLHPATATATNILQNKDESVITQEQQLWEQEEHDALSELLLAWYHSGYAAAKYQMLLDRRKYYQK